MATHPLVAASLCDLGNAITMEDRQPEGQLPLRQALAMRETLFGKEHPEVAQSLTSLADNLTDLNQFAEAEPLQIQALTMQRKFLPADDPDIFASLQNRARILQAQGRLAEAEETCRERLALASGKASLDLAGILFKMSAVLRD